MKTIAFDCDGTLLDLDDNIRENVLSLLINFFELGWKVFVHSGGGLQYAEMVVRKLQLEGIATPVAKGSYYNIAVDDIAYGKCDYLIEISN